MKSSYFGTLPNAVCSIFRGKGCCEGGSDLDYFFDDKKSIAIIVKKTLVSMAKGGFHDQLGGGFHRYSIKRRPGQLT